MRRRREDTERREGSIRVNGKYTHKNIAEVDDAAAAFGHGESQEARFATDAYDAEDTGFSFHRVKPGKRQGFGHRHDTAEEVYFVVSGSGRMKLDDDVLELAGRDARLRGGRRRPRRAGVRCQAPGGQGRAHPGLVAGLMPPRGRQPALAPQERRSSIRGGEPEPDGHASRSRTDAALLA